MGNLDFSNLDEMISVCRALGEPNFARQVAEDAAPLIDAEIKRTARAGTTPDGSPWAPKKDGKGRPLANVAEQLSTKKYGPKIKITLTGPAVFHNFGAGSPVRQVIPDRADALPEGLQKVLTKSAVQTFTNLLEGKK